MPEHMNIYAIIILIALLAEHGLRLAAAILNVKNAAPEVPAALSGVCDPAAYRRSQEYLRATTRFDMVSNSFGLLVLLGFWAAGGFNRLDVLVRGWGLNTVTRGLAYIALLLLFRAALALPFSAYATFVIETRFGFNRTTWRTFVGDLVKLTGLAVFLGGPLLAAVLALFESAGPGAWFYCWAATTVFGLVVQFVAPVWIMPLFNRFSPLPPGELRTAMQNYLNRVRFPVRGLFVIDGSRRSSHSNAFVAGFGQNRRIALYDTLIANHTDPELVAIVAHEVGHWKRQHVLKAMALSMAHAGVLFYLLSVFLQHRGLFAAFAIAEPAVYTGLVVFGLLYAPAELVLSLGINAMQRRHEYQADRYAAETTGTTEGMIAALKKLAAHNLTNLTPHPLKVALDYSHPPIGERVRALESLAT